MIIPLSESLRIAGKPLAWELQTLRTRVGQKVWTPIKYFQTLSCAPVDAGEREIRLWEGSTLADAIDAFTLVTARYKNLLDNAFLELAESADHVEQRQIELERRSSESSLIGQ